MAFTHTQHFPTPFRGVESSLRYAQWSPAWLGTAVFLPEELSESWSAGGRMLAAQECLTGCAAEQEPDLQILTQTG